MSYRKLTIEDNIYLYSIGRSFVKIKGDKQPIPLSKCGHSFRNSKTDFIVTPGTLSEYLKTGKVKQPCECICEKHNKSKLLSFNPFKLEIHGKKELMYGCEDCFDEVTQRI